MNIDKKLLESCQDLVQYMDMAADACLPQEIANVVKLHSKLAVGAAWIPVPGADMAAGAATIWGMYIRINNKLKIPFGENIMKSGISDKKRPKMGLFFSYMPKRDLKLLVSPLSIRGMSL